MSHDWKDFQKRVDKTTDKISKLSNRLERSTNPKFLKLDNADMNIVKLCLSSALCDREAMKIIHEEAEKMKEEKE